MTKNLTYYKTSINHFIDLSAQDATASIAKEHGLMGLTRLNMCMEKLGLDISNNYFIALPAASSMILNRSGESRHPCLVPDLQENMLTFHC